jgi:hypothetical protein
MGSPLRERGGVSDVVAAVLESARAGRGGSLFVEGEAGLGKSSVLGDVLRRVRRASHLCDEQQRTVVTHIRRLGTVATSVAATNAWVPRCGRSVADSASTAISAGLRCTPDSQRMRIPLRWSRSGPRRARRAA